MSDIYIMNGVFHDTSRNMTWDEVVGDMNRSCNSTLWVFVYHSLKYHILSNDVESYPEQGSDGHGSARLATPSFSTAERCQWEMCCRDL